MANKFEPYPGWKFRFDESGVAHHEERTDVKFIIAYGPWLWLLKRCGALAVTMPWKRIYILDQHKLNRSLRLHELVHIEQIERDGPVKFTIKYLYWLIRYGYWANPLEIEAYAKAPIAAE